jgi:hypothetical protein
MDTDKLFKAIQIVVKEEVKKQLSTIKEQIRKEVLAEMKASKPQKSTSLKNVVDESSDPFELATKILSADREQKQYSKNPMLNEILQETAVRPNFSRDDGSWGTITPDMIGYGNVEMSSTPSTIESTGNDILDKAMAKSAAVLKASRQIKR